MSYIMQLIMQGNSPSEGRGAVQSTRPGEPLTVSVGNGKLAEAEGTDRPHVRDDSPPCPLLLPGRHLAGYLSDPKQHGGVDVVLLQEVWCDGDAELLMQAAARGGLAHAVHFRSGVFGSGLMTLSRWPIMQSFFHRWGQHACWQHALTPRHATPCTLSVAGCMTYDAAGTLGTRVHRPGLGALQEATGWGSCGV